MTKKKPTVAIIYDFDGTLSPGNMQEFGFIQAIGKDKAEFWAKKSIGFRNNEREIDPHKYIKERGYDIKVETDKLSHYYLSKVNGGTL